MKTITDIKTELLSNKKISDLVFILWAGGAALLSYSLVYALRKPFTAASFDGLDAFGLDYKVLVTIVQILGYLIAKFVGIKLISELKKEHRMKFILASILVAELSLVLFGLLPAPYNIFAMFFNGLSLGCMWGVIFSFIEGRRTTDILASLLGIFAYVVGRVDYAAYLNFPYVPGAGEVVVVGAALIGAGLGFLWYNAYPAQVFMGDVGALALGGALGTMAIITRQELVLFIMGGVFVMETLSVILQVSYFKITHGKRIFLMTPIHHHFEMKGWKETQVVVRFWIITIVLVLIGLSTLKIR